MKTKTIVSGQLFRGILMLAMIALFSVSAYAQNGPNGITRADYINMTPQQQRDVLVNYVDYTITDLVNYSPSLAQSRDTYIWLTDAQFHVAPISRKDQVLENPTKYIVVDNPNLIPLITITQQQFNDLPPAKQDWVKNSGQYQIVP